MKSFVQQKIFFCGRFGGASLILLLAILLISSCSDDDERQKFDDNWRLKNEQKLDEIANNSEYTELKSLGNSGSIYYKVLEKGTGTKQIFYTSTVEVYYKGWYTVTYEDRIAGDVFDSVLYENNPPSTFSVNGDIIEGWKVALQHMVEGDKWEIWIPYQLGYGKNDVYDVTYGTLKMEGYTTLAFEIEVVSVTQ